MKYAEVLGWNMSLDDLRRTLTWSFEKDEQKKEA